MAHAYTPGLQMKAATRYRVQRRLPIAGEVLAAVGDRVSADTVVARTDQPGNVYPVNLANALSISAGEVPRALFKKQGDSVEQGELLARSKGIFGMFRQDYRSAVSGVIESVSHVTGQVIIRGAPIPVIVDAFISGTIVEVFPNEGVTVESDAAFLQGIFGIGGESRGTLRVCCEHPGQDLTADRILPELRGCVVVGGRRIHGDAVAKAREVGVAAIVSGGIDDQDLKEILGHDLGVAITGSEDLGITIIITEGFGEIPMADRSFALLRSLQGQLASVNGATQIRAGVLRPEIVVPIADGGRSHQVAARVGGGVLEIGSPVRLIRDPYFGELGSVVALPSEPQTLESGSKARVLEVECRSGKRVTVPRANVELVET